jgi:proprotein convertase subtilisin/kexin type 5
MLRKDKINQEVTTLVEYPIGSDTPISYYYPYFVKSHLITYSENDLDYYSLIAKCADKNCHYCEPLSPTKCKRCATGYYLYNNICLDTCPSGTAADTLRYTCIPIINNISYIKKYTKGSCVNKCGKKSEDCACDAACKSTGTCCTDYTIHNCDRIIEKSLIAKSNCSPPCEMCDDVIKDDKGLICNQCQLGWYMYNSKCFNKCPEGTISDMNMVCKQIDSII